MTYAVQARAAADRLVSFFGEGASVVIRRNGPGGLHNALTSDDVMTLAVDGTTAIGATSITLDAANLRGTLPQGAVLTIDGNAGHVVQADVTASGGSLSSVSILPALVAEAADDAVVTVTQAYGEWTQKAVRRSITEREQGNETFSGAEFVLVVSLEGYEGPEWADDVTVTFDGERVAVLRQMPFEPSDTRASMRLVCAGGVA